MKNLKDIILEHFENSKFSIIERLHINKDTGKQEYHYHPKTWDELKELVKKLLKGRGSNANLNDIDTSNITDMSELFHSSKFNGDISMWDVSNVEDMNSMFYNSKFNGDISNWDVRKVKNMCYMFFLSKFTGENGDISKWNVNNVKDMRFIFDLSPLEKNPPKWYKK